VELSRDSLADYAVAIDPDKRRSGGGGQRDGSGFGAGTDSDNSANGGDNADDGSTGGGVGNDRGGTGGGNPDKERDQGKFTGDAENLRDKILGVEEQNPLISLMNRLPGKKGQRWMVFPFSFEDQAHDFAVTLRILLMPELAAGNSGFRAERMALEIAGEDRRRNQYHSRWLFVVDNPPEGKLRLSGSFWPGISPSEKTTTKNLRAMERELAGLLGLAPEQVQMRDDEEFPPFAPDSRDETLFSVNEEA
jgi:hypothetical protein